jgi:ribosomal protein S18 acetylase RimI-like enzyme
MAPKNSIEERMWQPEAPELERAYREAIAALAPLIRAAKQFEVPVEDLDMTELPAELDGRHEAARMSWARELGPPMSWEAPYTDGPEDWVLKTYCLDLDSGTHSESASLFRTDDLRQEFHSSALGVAARAYKREAGWDHAPGEAGIWLIALRPRMWFPDPDEEIVGVSGDLIGFLILHDRDHDMSYESLAHIWTAARWRRRGIAAELMDMARARFPVTAVEGPATELGRSLLEARASDLLDQ